MTNQDLSHIIKSNNTIDNSDIMIFKRMSGNDASISQSFYGGFDKERCLLLAVFISLLAMHWNLGATTLKFVDEKGLPVNNVIVIADSQQTFLPETSPIIVDQVNREFVPHISVIRAGQRVEFPNSDNIRHHVYSFSQSNPFEIKLYKNRPTNPVVFNNPGIVTLGCNVHDNMLGFIFVAEANHIIWRSDEKGNVIVDGAESIRYWHPRLSITSTEVKQFQGIPDKDTHIITLALTPLPEPAATKAFGRKTFGKN